MVLIEFKLTAFGIRLVSRCRNPLYLKSNQFAKFVLAILIRVLTLVSSLIAYIWLGKTPTLFKACVNFYRVGKSERLDK